MEKSITDKIITRLNRNKATWLRKRINTGMSGTKGWPDITGITKIPLNDQFLGLRVEIEVKQPGKVPTTIQFNRLRKFRKLGAIAFWCDSFDSAVEQFEFWIEKTILGYDFTFMDDLSSNKSPYVVQDLNYPT